MITDAVRLREVIEEIARWSLQARRSYIGEIQKAFGEAAAEQLKDGLRQMWEQRK